MNNKKIAKNLDQFYTDKSVANDLLNQIKDNKILEKLGYKAINWIEPSAGTGVFIEEIKNVFNDRTRKIYAFDIDPKHKDIVKKNFFELEKKDISNLSKKTTIVIGNPPFGKRSSTAIKFINDSIKLADTVMMILPVQFQKWSVQSKIDKSLKLVYQHPPKNDTFFYCDTPKTVRTIFQVWTKRDIEIDNRLKTRPAIEHEHFELWQHNNTQESLKYFDQKKYKWDFAIPRQGYYDFSKKYYNPKDLRKNIQWIFIKINNEKANSIFNKIDFNRLSKTNTTIPGFGKSDLIKEYDRIYNE